MLFVLPRAALPAYRWEELLSSGGNHMATGNHSATLTILKGANQGVVLPLEGEKIILGRNADCQVVINVPAVSREHAMIRRIQNKFYIEDLKSRNGTFVNNQEVTARLQLKDNDRIKICDNQIGRAHV